MISITINNAGLELRWLLGGGEGEVVMSHWMRLWEAMDIEHLAATGWPT
jgi:hypothetical protein